jgi:hypothetical protein
MAELSEKLGDFRGENLIDRNSPSIETIQCGELTGPEARDVPMNLGNRSISFLHLCEV